MCVLLLMQIKFSELVLTSRGTVQLMQHPVSTGLVNGVRAHAARLSPAATISVCV